MVKNWFKSGLKLVKVCLQLQNKKKTRAETGLWVSPPGRIYTTLQNRLFWTPYGQEFTFSPTVQRGGIILCNHIYFYVATDYT
jgi:hypothetical protein